MKLCEILARVALGLALSILAVYGTFARRCGEGAHRFSFDAGRGARIQGQGHGALTPQWRGEE